MREHKVPQIFPWKMQEDIKSQLLVSLTDKNESTEPRYSRWQPWEVTTPLVKYSGFSKEFKAKLNQKFAWYHLVMLSAALGWHNLDFFCRTLMEIRHPEPWHSCSFTFLHHFFHKIIYFWLNICFDMCYVSPFILF